VEKSLQGRAALKRFRRAMWRRLAAVWLCGPALVMAGATVLGPFGIVAGVAVLAGIAITSTAPGLTIVYAMRAAAMSRRLRELPELPHASARRLPPPST
jgi:hypothetical protein